MQKLYNRNAVPRGFEVARGFEDKGIVLPYRTTRYAAGYDFSSPETVTIAPYGTAEIHTGVKAFMQSDEVLKLYVRSSLGIRKDITQGNSVSIIDADYYGNPGNEGHIQVAICNAGAETYTVKKGERIAQGMFFAYRTVDGDTAGEGAARTGGFGSTGKD